MSWKDSYIAKHGQEAYNRKLKQRRAWGDSLPGGEKQRSRERYYTDLEKSREYYRGYNRNHPEKVREQGRQVSRKGGKYYEKKLIYKQTGIAGERERVRMRHGYYWRPFKKIIAPRSVLHHEWIPGTAQYRGLALVERDAHRYGKINVIRILSGEITLLTEKDISAQPPGHKSQSSSLASGFSG